MLVQHVKVIDVGPFHLWVYNVHTIYCNWCWDFHSWLLRVFLVLVWGIALRAGFGDVSGGSPVFYTEYSQTLMPKSSTEKRGVKKVQHPMKLGTSYTATAFTI
eukprot:1560598-Rhodomonas_salina.1